MSMSCGSQHRLLVTEEGGVYTWGRNLEGQLGHGGRAPAKLPTRVEDYILAKKWNISSSPRRNFNCNLLLQHNFLPFFLILKLPTPAREGNIYITKINIIPSPYSFGQNVILNCERDGVGGSGTSQNIYPCVQVIGLNDDFICSAVCGSDFSVCISESGSLYGWGSNSAAQLGNP